MKVLSVNEVKEANEVDENSFRELTEVEVDAVSGCWECFWGNPIVCEW
jgi:hypothetical protein